MMTRCVNVMSWLAVCALLTTELLVGETTPALAAVPTEGLFVGSHAGMQLRSYNEHQTAAGSPTRNVAVWGAQTWIESGYTPGQFGVGADASLFAAYAPVADQYSRNMAHTDDWRQRGWAYPGVWDLKAHAGASTLKAGLLLTGPDLFMTPHDNRALPPTFRGGLLSNDQGIAGLSMSAGTFDRVVPRGKTDMQRLVTEYGHVPVKRFSFVGGTYTPATDTQVSMAGARATDVWNQVYFSMQGARGDAERLKWTGRVDYYHTTTSGAACAGRINNNAYSFSLSAQHRAHAFLLAYQQIVGDQFFDYLGETADDRLANSMDVDYNAPHERSIQVRYTADLAYYGVNGLKVMTWFVQGWGADASATAARLVPGQPEYGLYHSGLEPVHGSHHEVGLVPSYRWQSGMFRGGSVALYLMRHIGPTFYSDHSSTVARLVVNLPLTLL